MIGVIRRDHLIACCHFEVASASAHKEEGRKTEDNKDGNDGTCDNTSVGVGGTCLDWR
jgi:hypothetical protein